MNDLKIIVTACGCPGGSTLIRMLKNNGERRVVIVGTDMDNEAIGSFLTDKFYRVPPGWSKEYIPNMLDLVEKEKPDVLFPESTLPIVATVIIGGISFLLYGLFLISNSAIHFPETSFFLMMETSASHSFANDFKTLIEVSKSLMDKPTISPESEIPNS